jgi:cell division protein ZapA
MADKFKIRVNIAGRVYPINVTSVREEESLRRSAQKINDLVIKFERDYAVTDKQDVLAMCALQFASTLELDDINKDVSLEQAMEKLHRLNGLLADRIR